MENIGREIKRLLKEKGISVYKLAEDLGVANESLYRSLSNGANPEWKRIKQILDYLDYEIVLKPKRKEVNRIKSNRSLSRRK
jgi:DNA-binding phage protein